MDRTFAMLQHSVATGVIALTALFAWFHSARAEMGPCVPDNIGGLICGQGDGAAQIVLKTRSPSHRLAFAWRLANRPPTDRPGENDPKLENLIVRIVDGAVLAKSNGTYWDLGTKIAKAYMYASWSPDSRLLVKVEQRAESASAELFFFTQDDAATGPFELVKMIDTAMQAKIQGVKDTGNHVLVFSAKPEMTIDDQGVIHAVVYTMGKDSASGPLYEVTLQVARGDASLEVSVVSVAPYHGTSISVIVH